MLVVGCCLLFVVCELLVIVCGFGVFGAWCLVCVVLFGARCWLFVVRGSLFVVWLFGHSLFVVRCLLLFVVCWYVLVTCLLLCVVCWLLLVGFLIRSVLCVVCCLLLVGSGSLCFVVCGLSSAWCL